MNCKASESVLIYISEEVAGAFMLHHNVKPQEVFGPHLKSGQFAQIFLGSGPPVIVRPTWDELEKRLELATDALTGEVPKKVLVIK